MLRFDFKTYTKDFLKEESYQELLKKKAKCIEQLRQSTMAGWTEEINSELVEQIQAKAEEIKNKYDCMVVIGIGGSYLGSYAFHELFKKYYQDSSFEVLYAGYTLSTKYISDLLEYVQEKNVFVNVISKSGNTKEIMITYEIFKNLLKRKYGEQFNQHILITTNEKEGYLRKEVEENHYDSLPLPDHIGGRYSFITAAHLFPLALNYDIHKIVDGYYDGKRYIDEAFQYAFTRKMLFDQGKVVENFCVWEQNMTPFCEWLKQLFGETEGKESKGILPTSVVYSRDLHSLGQFIQEGNKILFETFITVNKDSHYIDYEKENLQKFTNLMITSVEKAHFQGKTPIIEIELSELSLENVAEMIYFFQLSAAFSAFLMGVEPFNQPGVEVYKQEMSKELND